MTTLRRTAAVLSLVPLAAVALLTTACGDSDNPSAPTSTSAVGSVVLTPSTVSLGAAVSGVVRLTSAAPAGGARVALTSSNTSVATVQALVVLQEGATSGAFSVVTAAAGTSAISAGMDGVSSTAMLTVTARASLASISFSSDSVIGGESVVGTVTLTDNADAGGAMVLLSTGDPVSVPESVTVPSGQRSAVFTAATRSVGGTISTTVRATYASVSMSARLSVMPVNSADVAVAGFGVAGSTTTDTCVLTNDGNNLECHFDGSLSKAPGTIVAWDWTYTVVTTLSQTTTGPVLDLPVANCGFLPPPPLPDGTTSFPLTVTLTIRDSLGNVSETATHSGARVLPHGFCGF